MPIFPKIERPCPYVDRLDEIMDGDVCRMCQRQVFDLTDMDDAGRMAFLATCSGETCVSYRLPARAVLAATMLASMAMPLAAAAQDAPTVEAQVNYEDDMILAGAIATRRPMTMPILVRVLSKHEARKARAAARRARKAEAHNAN